MTQIFALDSTKRLISIYQAKDRKNYFCRECGGILRTRGGIHRQRHFFHLQLSPSCRQSEKSLEHLQTQYSLLNLFPQGEGVMERQFPEIGRIADVVWETKKLVFEVQCSSISKEEVEARNRDYSSLGYQVVWILHEKKFNKWRVTAAESFLRDSPHYYTNMDKSGRGEIYDQIEGHRRGVRQVFRRLSGVDLSQSKELLSPLDIRSGWQVYFSGDLIDCQKKSGQELDKVVKKAGEYERGTGSRATPSWQFCKEWTYRLIVRPYLLLFQILLEKACR